MTIVRSDAKSWYKDENSGQATRHAPDKAHDGDYETTYNVKDGDVVGNYLKLHLTTKYRIETVKLVNIKKGCCEKRILNTKVMLYLTQGVYETKVQDCGDRITGG